MKKAVTIIGREKEQRILKEFLESDKSEFLALYGRRRVGKTYLITNFFDDSACVFFYVSGIQKGNLKEQVEQFYKQIGNVFYNGATIARRYRWLDVFDDLTKAMQQLNPNQKIVLYLDEFPWMATKRSGLLTALDHYWNRYWSHDRRIKLVICGSSASWIIEKIINNKAGLYNRVTRSIHLEPFTLNETKKFLTSIGVRLNNKQILNLYMVLGGIPQYLAYVKKGMSAHQCIDELCFQKDGPMVKEFSRLFASLFQDSELYINLIYAIAKYRNGIGQSALIKESNIPEGGRTVHRLKELEDVGFIISFLPHGHQEKGIYYKINDEYILFYLDWIMPKLSTIRKQNNATGYWLSKIQSSSWRSWSGYAFEAVCFKHLLQIRKALKIDPGAEVGAWRYVSKSKDDHGAQIDLLFDRPDNVITICEIKFNESPFIIDKTYMQNLKNKMEIYIRQTKTLKQIFLAMITANGLKESMYSEEMVSGIVTLDNLFE